MTDSKNDKQIIAELTEEVGAQAERIKNILNDKIITKDVKALISAGQIIEAEKLVDNASIEQEDKKLAAVHYERGRVKELRLKYDQAKESFGKAVVLQPENTTYLNAFASILYYLAEYDKAIGYFELALASDLATFELALASDLATFGEGHPQVAIYRNNLGSAWDAKGQYDKAIGYYELALATMKKVFGDNHPSTQTIQRNLELVQNEQ